MLGHVDSITARFFDVLAARFRLICFCFMNKYDSRSCLFLSTSMIASSIKANLTAEGHRLDNLPVPSMPWRPCTNLCFFLAEY